MIMNPVRFVLISFINSVIKLFQIYSEQVTLSPVTKNYYNSQPFNC